MKLKVTPADKSFSLWIRHRDDMTCQKCKIQYEYSDNQLDCSHYKSRSKRSVRFDEENCVTLCKSCHLYFDGNTWLGLPKREQEHREFMIKRLGLKRLEALEVRALLPVSHFQVDEKQLKIHYDQELENLKSKKKVLKGFGI